MQTVDLRKDAEVFRRGLESEIQSIASEKPGVISAIEIGYSCNQSGWIFIHADRRPQHKRDGEWTGKIDEDRCIEFNHWIDAVESTFEGEGFAVIKHDESQFNVPACDLDAEMDDAEDEETCEGDCFVTAVGEMILDVLMRARNDGVFASLTAHGQVQLDIEDFYGGWGWPKYEELGVTNLA